MPSPIFDAPLTSTLVPTTAGNPTFTFTRATTAYVADQDGILRNASANEARFMGARRVRNWLVGNSTDATVAGWTKGNATPAFGATGPTGLADASTITATATNGQAFANGSSTSSRTFRSSIWVKRRTGVGTVGLFTADGGAIADITSQVDGTWKRFAVPSLTFNSDPYVGVRCGTSGDAVDIAYAQIEDVSGQSNQAPGDYVSVGVLASPWHGAGVDSVKYFATTNGNSVAANIVTEATGSLIPAATLLGYVAENAATNLCLQSQTFDVTASGWTTNNNSIAANDAAAPAPDGTITADRFTDTATNTSHALGSAASATSGAPITFSVYVKAGTLTWMQLVQQTGSNFWANFNIQTGVVGSKAAGVTSTIQSLPNGWYRCSMTLTAGAATNSVFIASLSADTASFLPAYVGTGQTMYLWGAQVETGSEPSSYIATTTVAVVRNVDVLSYAAASNVSGTLGTSYAEAYLPSAWASDQQDVITNATPIQYFQYYPAAKTLNMYASAIIKGTVNTRSIGAINKGASAWGGATFSISLNGGAVATDVYSAVTLSGPIYIGGSPTPAETLRGSIRNVKFYSVRLTDAQLIDLTEDGVLTPDPEPPSIAAQGGTATRYRRRRIEVEIDGEVFPVSSEAEGRELLLKAREAAKQAAQAAAVRAAAKAEKKTSPAAVERALALSTPRISLRADDRSEALAQAIQAQVDAAQAAIDEDYATARRMAYAYVRQRLQEEQRQRELAADEEEVIAMILRLP